MNLKIASDKVTDTQGINMEVAKDQEEYNTIPANYADGVMAFAFELTEEDIDKIKKNKRIYISLLTFGRAMNPINVAVDPVDFDENCKYNREELVKQRAVFKVTENASASYDGKGGNKNV